MELLDLWLTPVCLSHSMSKQVLMALSSDIPDVDVWNPTTSHQFCFYHHVRSHHRLGLKYNNVWVDLCLSTFALQSIFPIVVRVIILIHKTDCITSSVQHVPVASCLTQGKFSIIVSHKDLYSLTPLQKLNFISHYSPLYLLYYNHTRLQIFPYIHHACFNIKLHACCPPLL